MHKNNLPYFNIFAKTQPANTVIADAAGSHSVAPPVIAAANTNQPARINAKTLLKHHSIATSLRTLLNAIQWPNVIAREATATKQSTDQCRRNVRTKNPTQKANSRTTVMLNLFDYFCRNSLISCKMSGFPQHLKQKTLKRVQGDSCSLKTCAAFSLVEMLMALLVASLLMAALAPVMTKRMDEAKINISGVGAAQYDKDAIIQIFTKDTEDKTFYVPNDVNAIKVIAIGGGGAGGSSFFGKQEVTSSKDWTVPAGVTKLRVFLVGGGGGGASGGLGSGTAYGDIPATTATETCKDFLTPGETSFTIPNNASWVVPALNDACKASGVTQWTLASDNSTKYTPGQTAGAELKVTACGGGGGGGSTGYPSGGGCGGYIVNKTITSNVSTIYIKIPNGGGASSWNSSAGSGGYYGGGGGGGTYSGTYSPGTSTQFGGSGGTANGSSTTLHGGNGTGSTTILAGGGDRAYSSSGGNWGAKGGSGSIWGGGGGGGGNNSGSGGGGGGGGPTTISTLSGATDVKNILFQIGGGGGAGGGDAHDVSTGGGGGAGGGYGAGGGGGGTDCNSSSNKYGVGGSGSEKYSDTIGIGRGSNGYTATGCNGGFGGNGYGASMSSANSTAGGKITDSLLTNIFSSSSYCSGGKAGENGKQGALRLCYGTSGVRTNALKCDYSLPANGSGGGGAGQITVGEITVIPGETLTFNIGRGGISRTAAGKNGDPGVATTITRKSNGEVLARAEGGLAGQYSSSATAASQGGAKRSTYIMGNNWTGIDFDTKAGSNGTLATAVLNKGYGGAGGASMNIKGEVLQGGLGGNTAKNGASPATGSYGAGGGGGSGSQSEGDTTFGVGAGGASGYIYFEYGGTNGGGGTTGEVVTKYISNLKAGIEIPITIGEGGKATGDGAGGETKFGTYLTARGGFRGYDGGMGLNEHAKERPLPNGGANKDESGSSLNYANSKDPLTKGGAGTPTYGGIGGYLEALYENADGTWANYVKAKDGTIGGPVAGGCGGNLATLMSGITCNDPSNTANGKNGSFGGGGGGGAVVNDTGGIGGNGGDGVVILEYKSVSI